MASKDNLDAIVFFQQIMKLLHESKSDCDIEYLLAHAHGMETANELYHMNEGRQLLNALQEPP